MISCAASLAHHGLLKSLEHLRMIDVDLGEVPTHQLVTLASCVTISLRIQNVSGCDMVAFLDSVKCRLLRIYGQKLRTEDTQALVRAMETSVFKVYIGNYGEVTLDIEALTKYNHQGKCKYIYMAGWRYLEPETRDKYEEALSNWPAPYPWSVSHSHLRYHLRRRFPDRDDEESVV